MTHPSLQYLANITRGGKDLRVSVQVDVPSAEISWKASLEKNFETNQKQVKSLGEWKKNFLQQCLSPLTKITDGRYAWDKKLSLLPSRMWYLRDTLQMAAGSDSIIVMLSATSLRPKHRSCQSSECFLSKHWCSKGSSWAPLTQDNFKDGQASPPPPGMKLQ